MTDIQPPLSAEDLEAATTEVLGALGVSFDAFDVAPGTPDRLMARVSIHGHDVIDLSVEVPGNVAVALAAMFFGTDAEESGPSDLVDAMGELANITAGAIKPVLDGHWVIGIPDRFDPAPITSDNSIRAVVPLGRGAATITVAVAAVDRV